MALDRDPPYEPYSTRYSYDLRFINDLYTYGTVNYNEVVQYPYFIDLFEGPDR